MPIIVRIPKHAPRALLAQRPRGPRRGGNTVRARLGSAVPDRCLICQGSILEGGKIVMCPYCGSVYHLECLKAAAEGSGAPLAEVQCFYCGRKMMLPEVLDLVGER